MRLRGDDQHRTWTTFLWAFLVFGFVFAAFTLTIRAVLVFGLVFVALTLINTT